MLVTIVAVPNADNTGLDTDRMEKVEDLHPDVARPMLDLGTARLPSEEELDVYRKARLAEQGAADGSDTVETQDDHADASTETAGQNLAFTPRFATTPSRTAKRAAATAPAENTPGTPAA